MCRIANRHGDSDIDPHCSLEGRWVWKEGGGEVDICMRRQSQIEIFHLSAHSPRKFIILHLGALTATNASFGMRLHSQQSQLSAKGDGGSRRSKPIRDECCVQFMTIMPCWRGWAHLCRRSYMYVCVFVFANCCHATISNRLCLCCTAANGWMALVRMSARNLILLCLYNIYICVCFCYSVAHFVPFTLSNALHSKKLLTFHWLCSDDWIVSHPSNAANVHMYIRNIGIIYIHACMTVSTCYLSIFRKSIISMWPGLQVSRLHS